MRKEDVFNYLLKIPKGCVTTYKDIANFLDNKGYQAIGQILHTNIKQFEYPCYRVVKADGSLSSNYKFGGPKEQKRLLLEDGVPFIGNQVDLDKCRFELILETKRLYLRKLVLTDLTVLNSMMNDRVMFHWERHFTKEDIYNWYLTQVKRYESNYGLLACVLKETNQVIGQVGLIRQNSPIGEITEICYLFNDAFWHNGYAREATSALIKKTIAKEKVIYATIKWNNFASQRVALANNMTKVGEFTKIYYNKVMKHLIYRVEENEISRI